MKQVCDENGTEIKGLFRSNDGSLVVIDKTGLDKYRRQKTIYREQQEKIQKLDADVEELKALVHSLIEAKING